MATTIRQLLINAVKTAMEAITTGNGHEVTVPKVHKVGKATINLSERYTIVVDDLGDDHSWNIRDAYVGTIHLTIRGVVRSGSDDERAEAASDLMAAIMKRLTADELWGGLARKTRVTQMTPNLEEPTQPIGTVAIACDISYAVERTNPYVLKAY